MPEWEAEKNWVRLTWFLLGMWVSGLLTVAYRVGENIKWGW